MEDSSVQSGRGSDHLPGREGTTLSVHKCFGSKRFAPVGRGRPLPLAGEGRGEGGNGGNVPSFTHLTPAHITVSRHLRLALYCTKRLR